MLIVHLFVSYAHVNLCIFFFSSCWCRGLAAASACGSSWTFLFTLLFSVYINDLAQDVNSLGCGVQLVDAMISTLLYGDDIVLISPSAEKLQTVLNTLDLWCKKMETDIKSRQDKSDSFQNFVSYEK